MIGDRSKPIEFSLDGDGTLQIVPSSRDEQIALAGAAILACLGNGDQMDSDHQSVLDDPSSAVFCVLVPNWARGADLADRVDEALKTKGLVSWCKRTMVRAGDGVRVEISVVVGEAGVP